MTEVVVVDTKEAWDEQVLEHGGHPLQLWGWGEVKKAHGWSVLRVSIQSDGEVQGLAQLLFHPLPGPFRALAYIPRGPVCNVADREVVLGALDTFVREHHPAVAITIEPDWEDVVLPEDWQPSANTILIPRTIILDLHKDEEVLLAEMAKKTRQYIRKSAKEVEIRQVKNKSELQQCLAIYKETARRAAFALHDDDYYYDVFDKMDEHSPVFAAFRGGKMVAFLWLAISKATAFELYGGVTDVGQETRANYALKWHAIQLMQKWGLERYDFNGLLNDGVSTFKQSFSAHENKLIGTYDKPLSPLYGLWAHGLPLAKKVARALKRRA